MVFDRRPTHRSIRGSQSFPSDRKASVSSSNCTVRSRDLDRERILVAPRLYALPSLVASTTVRFLDLRKVSNSSELNSFLLIMCIDAESTTNSRSSGDFEVGAGIALVSMEE